MSTHKKIDKICLIITAAALVITLIFCNGTALGIETAAYAAGYEQRLFDTSKVHTIDIVTDDWDSFIETCEREEYSACSVVIDGEAFKNVGIRGKGNTSLSNVSSMNSERYSFKIEFDQYDSTKSYYGLDKLCLNNIIQDNTFMKDYLAYTLMSSMSVNSPLCSYAYITVNGEDWGLYLAVEGVEEAFLERNYGSSYGDLYKPDSMSFGGGRGNGADFRMSGFMNEHSEETDNSSSNSQSFAPEGGFGEPPDFKEGNMPDFGSESRPDFNGESMPDFNRGSMPELSEGNTREFGGNKPDFGGMGGMGSSDVKLQYVDDDPESYSNIFENAKTNVSEADQKRLISALKALSEGENIEDVVNTDEVIRYFAVHNFLCNGDSYTGSMIHNYYLYEEDGQLSMIPWDYNLAFGTFQGADASSAVNSPIDTPVSGDMSDRPMIAWIFANDEHTKLYHNLLAELIANTDFAELINGTAALIDEYVQRDPTKFCTYEEFKKGVETIREFCLLRAESVSGQLNGSIPSTTDDQNADSSALIDASGLRLSDMGIMNKGGSGNINGAQKNRVGNNDATADFPDQTAMQPANSEETSDNSFSEPPGEKNSGTGKTTPDNGSENISPPDAPPEGSEMPSGLRTDSNHSLPLLIISTIVLAAGLTFAIFFKH